MKEGSVFLLFVLMFALSVVGGAVAMYSDTNTRQSDTDTETRYTAQYSSLSTETEARKTSTSTLGEKKALIKAGSYLSLKNGWSKERLKHQLEFEGFTSSEATYGVDHCTADWNEQAELRADSYLSMNNGWSEKRLRHQLEYEGFTLLQIEHAIENCGADWNEQAELRAASYMRTMSYSYERLVRQLESESEGFTHDQAVHGALSVSY